MKNVLLTCAVASAGFLAIAGSSNADVNDAMKDSQYCRDNSMDVICMGPESQKMRADMMAWNKEKAMETRTKYCGDGNATDPICDDKLKNDSTGY